MIRVYTQVDPLPLPLILPWLREKALFKQAVLEMIKTTEKDIMRSHPTLSVSETMRKNVL